MRERQYSLWLKLTVYFLFYPLFTTITSKEGLQTHVFNSYFNVFQVSSLGSLKSNLSFIYLALQEEHLNSYNAHITSQEIIINGINNVMMKSKLISFLSIPINNNTIFDLEKVHNWITKMKFSGFFCNVEYLVQSVDQHQIVHINLKVNPIFKKICIFNYKNKIIPYSFILTEFRQQLGYPLNFFHINKATEGITKWYHRRGYDLAIVRLVSLRQYDNSLVIDIIEGTIKRIEIHVEAYPSISGRDQFILKVPLLLNILNVKIEKIFNRYDLENGLKKLNQNNLIRHGSYKVNGKVDLSLVIVIEPKSNKTIYLFGEKRELVNRLIKFFGSLASIPVTKIRHKDFLTSFTSVNKLPRTWLDLDTAFSLILYQQNTNILRAVFSHSLYSWLEIYKSFSSNLSINFFDNFGLKYYFNGVGFKNTFVLLHSMLSNSGHYLHFMYSTYFIKNITNYISYEIFQESKLHIPAQFIFMRCKPEVVRNYSESHRLLQTFVAFKSDLYLSMNFFFNRKLSIKNLSYKYIHFYRFSNWYNLHLFLTSQDYHLILPKFQNIWNENIEYFTKLQWSLEANALILQYQSFKFFLKSVCIIPFEFSEVSNTYCVKYNYTNKIIVGAETTINICRQQINILGLVIKVIGNEIYIPAFEQNLLIGPNLIRGYSESLSMLPNQLRKISLEYLILIRSKNSLFLFFDYAYGLECYDFTNFNDSRMIPNALEYKLNSKYQMSYGIGFHFQAPIRQIPALRFEYGYNIDRSSCFHIRIKKNKL